MLTSFPMISISLLFLGAVFYMKRLRSCTDLIRCESELHGWISRMPCPILSHMGSSEVATARAHRPGSSNGDGEADVEPATKTWMASERMLWQGEQASTGNGKQLDRSQIRAVGSCCQSTADIEIPWPHCWYVLHQHERTTGQAMSVEIK